MTANGDRRGQTNLPVLAIALVVLTAVTGMTIAMADGARTSAERDATERSTAVSAADRFVAADANHTRRENVLDAARIGAFDADDLASLVPETHDADVLIRVGGETVVERGDAVGGTTVRRVVLVAKTDAWEGTTSATDGEPLTVPNRTETVELDVRGGARGDVRTVRINERIVAHDPNGLGESNDADGREGPIRVNTSRYETLTLSVDGDGGTVHVTAFPEHTERAIVRVTVDV